MGPRTVGSESDTTGVTQRAHTCAPRSSDKVLRHTQELRTHRSRAEPPEPHAWEPQQRDKQAGGHGQLRSEVLAAPEEGRTQLGP